MVWILCVPKSCWHTLKRKRRKRAKRLARQGNYALMNSKTLFRSGVSKLSQGCPNLIIWRRRGPVLLTTFFKLVKRITGISLKKLFGDRRSQSETKTTKHVKCCHRPQFASLVWIIQCSRNSLRPAVCFKTKVVANTSSLSNSDGRALEVVRQ